VDKYTIVPAPLFSEECARELLSRLTDINNQDEVKFIELPSHEAVLIYINTLPKIYEVIKALDGLKDHNRVIFHYEKDVVDIAVAMDNKLLAANSYKAVDFTTALYYIFALVNNQQINPEVTTIYSLGEIKYEEAEILFKYFKDVEQI